MRTLAHVTQAYVRARARIDEVASGADAVQTARGTTLAVSEKDDVSNGMTLEQFQNALVAHPDATRFVIAADGIIQSQNETSGAAGKNRSENITITQTLRMALQNEHMPKGQFRIPLS